MYLFSFILLNTQTILQNWGLRFFFNTGNFSISTSANIASLQSSSPSQELCRIFVKVYQFIVHISSLLYCILKNKLLFLITFKISQCCLTLCYFLCGSKKLYLFTMVHILLSLHLNYFISLSKISNCFFFSYPYRFIFHLFNFCLFVS